MIQTVMPLYQRANIGDHAQGNWNAGIQELLHRDRGGVDGNIHTLIHPKIILILWY